jgi:hypothetical protein
MVSVQRIVERRIELRVMASHRGDTSQRLNYDTSHSHPLHKKASNCVPFGVVEDLQGIGQTQDVVEGDIRRTRCGVDLAGK